MSKPIEIFTTLTLQYPIRDGEGKAITELKIRRLKVYDIKQMNNYKGTDADKELFLLGQLTEMIPEDLEQLDIADYSKVQEALKAMLAGKLMPSSSTV